MKNTKRKIALLLVLAMILSLFTACSNQSENNLAETDEDEQTSNVPETNEKTEAVTEAVTPEAPASKTFSVAVGENMTELHPLNQATLPGKAAMFMVYDTLVASDHEGAYTPMLATDWDVSDDGKVWTFNLRNDVSFHNGEPFNSADVVNTFEILLANPDTLVCSTQYWTNLDSVSAVDEDTVEIHLFNEMAAGVFLMGCANTYIIPDEAYAEYGDSMFTNQQLWGTGPWLFDEWVDGQYVHMLKNEEYWGDLDSYYSEFYMRFITEPSTAVNAHLSKTVNAYVTTGGIDPDLLSLYDGYEDEIDVFEKSCGTFYYIGMQCAGAFKDKNVRLAFEHAIDRETIMVALFGDGQVPSSFIPESCFGYDESLENYVYDPEAAKQYLADSSYDGSEIVLSSNTATKKADTILLAMSEMLNEVGFNTSVSIVEGATLLDMRSTGEYDAFMVTWSHNFGDPFMFLNQRVLQDAHHTNYKNDKVSALIEASAVESDEAPREQQIKDLVKLMREDAAPYYPVVLINSTFAVDMGVTGVDIFSDGIFDFRNIDYTVS